MRSVSSNTAYFRRVCYRQWITVATKAGLVIPSFDLKGLGHSIIEALP